jgi:hypothetical protein
MDNENNTIMSEDEDVLLPDGWAEGDDIFADEGWTGDTEQTDEPAPEPEQTSEEDTTATPDEAPTTEPEDGESGEDGADQAETPTTEPSAEDAHKKLKFTARVDRADLDVEVDESELPTLYQKAQVVDRVQAKLAKVNPLVEKAEKLSKTMGFDSFADMLDSAEQNYRDAEINRLVGEGVHQEVAAEMVGRKFEHAAEEASTNAGQSTSYNAGAAGAKSTGAQAAGRDFATEVRELLTERPELQGTKIPSEVVQACVGGKPLMAAYAAYEVKQQKAEADKLRKENNILKQNAASAARAPVSRTSGGGATDTKPKDDFLRGFEDDDY